MLNEFLFWISLGSGGIELLVSLGDFEGGVACLAKGSTERTGAGCFELVVKELGWS